MLAIFIPPFVISSLFDACYSDCFHANDARYERVNLYRCVVSSHGRGKLGGINKGGKG
jgi:hypothetical protein